MTTIIGVKTETGPIDAVLLCADTQVSLYAGEIPEEKKSRYKMFFGDFWALAYSGPITDDLRMFTNRFSQPERYRYKNWGKAAVEEAVLTALSDGRFMEVDALNAAYSRRLIEHDESLEAMHEFLLAVNKPKLELYRVDSYGNLISVRDKRYLLLAPTSEIEKLVQRSIDDTLDGESIDANTIDLQTAFRLCRTAIKRSERDITSSGPMDLVIVRKEGVYPYGKQIRKALLTAEDAECARILAEQETISGDRR